LRVGLEAYFRVRIQALLTSIRPGGILTKISTTAVIICGTVVQPSWTFENMTGILTWGKAASLTHKYPEWY